jgi:hypothetical protein
LGKAYGLNTQVLLANLQHFCNNIIIILNYYYFIPGLFPSHSWWAESCSVRLGRGMACNRQPRSFQDVDPHGRPDGWTEGGWRDARSQGKELPSFTIYDKGYFYYLPTNNLPKELTTMVSYGTGTPTENCFLTTYHSSFMCTVGCWFTVAPKSGDFTTG